MSRLPGADIITEILNGNEKVISTVYKKVYRHLETYGKSLNASNQNVKESVQDAFEVFYRQILDKKLELNCTVDTYIISIAKRLLHKIEQEIGNYSEQTIDLHKDEPIDEEVSKQTLEELRHQLFVKVFNTLKDECKEVIRLTLLGYRSSEIMGMMNYTSESFVRIKRQRCKNHLIQKIKESSEYEKLRNAKPEDYEFPL